MKLVIIWESQNMKTIFQKATFQIGQEKILLFPNGAESIGAFSKKELQKTSQKGLRIEKVINRKGNKLFVKWKAYSKSFNNLVDKKGYSDMKNELFSRTAC